MSLLAIMFLLQVCAGFASPVPADVAASASLSEGAYLSEGQCCGIPSGQGCDASSKLEAVDTCARHCAQPGSVASPHVALPASCSEPACEAGAYTQKLVFPPHRPILTAAPPAVSSTPLIYHLQRLLN
jgi:hypothetical protein